MDIVKNGESSTSPRALNGEGGRSPRSTKPVLELSNLVMPEFDVFPLRPVHASHDMISLLNLTGLHATHVRPYAATSAEDGQVSDDEGQGPTSNRARRRMKIEKGYQHLLPDCIDPVPAGDKAGIALMPLMDDFGHPPGAPPGFPEGPLEMLGMDVFQAARLEPGTQKGYQRGEKNGVKEAEIKRRRRREQRHAQSLSMGPDGLSLPSPALQSFDHPTPQSPGVPPLPPSQYTHRPYMPHAQSRGGGPGTPRGGMSGRGGFNPGKRPYDGTPGGGTPKRGRGGYRTGSEAPRGRGRPGFSQHSRSKTDF